MSKLYICKRMENGKCNNHAECMSCSENNTKKDFVSYADNIREMNDMELAVFLYEFRFSCYGSADEVLDYLKAELGT